MTACGKKGPPLAPLRTAPGAIKDLQAARSADRVTLRFTVPAANQDGTVPALVERVEIYAVSPAAGAAAPTAAAIVTDANLLQSVDVNRSARSSGADATPKDTRPVPGEVATYVDKTVATAIRRADAPTKYYLAVAVAGRSRRGVPSLVVAVPLGRAAAAPVGLTIDYDETTMTLAWTAAPTVAVLVEEVVTDAAGVATRKTLTPKPVPGPSWSLPVEMGRQRCFALRPVETTGSATIEGGPGEPVCVTPADKFPPATPAQLVAIPGAGAIDLSWLPADAPDLAGYMVYRGEGSGETMQPLMTTPTAATSYRDASAKPGATYVYFVVALDKAGNASLQSNRQTVTAR